MAVRDIGYCNNRFKISYHIINNHAKKNMLFLHGWGSNKEIMRMAFDKYFLDFNHLYIDLPGFGGSSNNMVLSTHDYANIVTIILQEISINGVDIYNVVVGHSFGGKIALLLQYPIILLSSAGILLPKSLKTKLKIILAKIAKHSGLQLGFLKAQDAQNLSPIMYETFKRVVNEDFSQHYANFKLQANIFWGEKDEATPLAAYSQIRTLMPHAKAHVLQGDHYFFLKQGALIEQLYNQ